MRWDFGACQKKYIPYTPMVITLAAIKWWVDIDRQYDEKFKGTIKDKLRRWYWGAVFNQSYEKATDNVVSSDYSLLREWLAIGNRRRTPSGISYKLSKQNIENAIDDIDTSGDARYKAILCLPLINGAEDIYSRECLSQTMLHDHHIYPKRAKGIKDEFSIAELNNVINRMLITDRTNQEIKNKSPYDYLVDCKGKMLKKHFLFKDIYGKRLSYNSFLKRRKKFIIKYLYNLINR
jgi:hypothetical protein